MGRRTLVIGAALVVAVIIPAAAAWAQEVEPICLTNCGWDLWCRIEQLINC